MPRNISFSLTTTQFRNRTKTVTRRKRWEGLEAGTILNGCEKCMGLKPGEKIVRLGQIRVVAVTRERLSRMDEPLYGNAEARKEGFPGMTGKQFVDMFCQHQGGERDQVITRIEYEYLEGGNNDQSSN